MSSHEFLLTQDQIDFADKVASDTYNDAVFNKRDRIGHGTGGNIQHSYVRGYRAQCAFYLWLGGKSIARWGGFIKNATAKQLAEGIDVYFRDYKIDVKSKPANWNAMEFIVRKRSLSDDHVYVFANADDHPLYRFNGWAWGREIREITKTGGRRNSDGAIPDPGHIFRMDHPMVKDCRLLIVGTYLVNGHFMHSCAICGVDASFGYGVSLRLGILGEWYCREHRPEEANNA
jgi:hypothetical protein